MAWLGVITNNGNDLLTRWVEGKNLHITRAAAGQGRVEQTAMLAQSALVNEKQTVSIVSNTPAEKGQRLKLQVTAQAAVGYNLNQFGVWARLDEEEDQMIALFQTDTDIGIEIPSKEAMPDFVYTFYGLLENNKKQNEFINAMQEEQTLICYGLRGALQGLVEQGCNGPCKDALARLDKHLNKSAHPHIPEG